jgi:hypothetical protein
MARDGAEDLDIAEFVIRGVELDIRRDGGAPAFKSAVENAVAASRSKNAPQLLAGVNAIRREFVDSPLTRHIADAAEKVGLEAITNSLTLTPEHAAKALIVRLGSSRCCDGMTGYVARNRTKNLAESQRIVDSIKSKLAHTGAAQDLTGRMLNCSAKGLPARVAKPAPVPHSVEGLSEEL